MPTCRHLYRDSAFRTSVVQVSRPPSAIRGAQIAWLGETRPVLLVTADAAPKRIPSLATDPSAANDLRWLVHDAVRDAFKAGSSLLRPRRRSPLAGSLMRC